MPLTIVLIKNVLRLYPDTTNNVWKLQYSSDGGNTWNDIMDIDYITPSFTLGGATTINGDASVSGNGKFTGWISHTTPLRTGSASPTLGTGGTLGAASDVLTPDANHVGVIPIGGSITVGGTVGTAEKITVQINAVYSDGTSGSISKEYTATGTYDLSLSDIVALIKDGVYITKITAQAASSATSTSATVSVSMAGIQQ